MLLAFDGETGRGSGRCNNGLHLRDALGACSDLLVAHGGHAAAAGLEIKRENFDAFCARFAEACERMAPTEHPLRIDGEATFQELDPQTLRRLDALGPFGNGHPKPRFLTHGVKIVGNPFVETRGQHVRVRVNKEPTRCRAMIRGAPLFEELRRNKGPEPRLHAPSQRARRRRPGPARRLRPRASR